MFYLCVIDKKKWDTSVIKVNGYGLGGWILICTGGINFLRFHIVQSVSEH
jgi:hypothetical protein